jgi:hypothetical protein
MLAPCVVSPASAGDWKFPIGVTYSSGFQDVIDYHEDAIGVDADFSFPIGVSFHPYIEFEKGHRIGIDVGPVGIIFIETNFSEDKDYFNLPVGATYGYAFARDGSVVPYVRAGVRYNIAGGDFVDGSSPGLIGAIGLEMARQKRVSFGLEVAYDNATIDLKDDFGFSVPDEEVDGGFQLGFRVIF